MVNKYKAGGMSHIIDYFLFVGPANSSQRFHDLQNFLHLCQRLSVPIKDSKTVLPSKVIIIHGIEVNSEKNGMSPSTRQDFQTQYCTNISYA